MLKSRKASQEACKTKREKKIKKKNKKNKEKKLLRWRLQYNAPRQEKALFLCQTRRNRKREEKDKKHLMLSCFDTMKKLDK
jgi:hypothetical protein